MSPATLVRLAQGRIQVRGLLPWSSNQTFLVGVDEQDDASGDDQDVLGKAIAPGGTNENERLMAIYKPELGERPLRDFPPGLWRREIAAYELDQLLGWTLVPPTVAREDAPFGPGSLQYCVDAQLEEHYFTLFEHQEHRDALRRMAAFDLLANNADRKGGHCLADNDGRIWAIDNGLCFHHQPKLRTVIWDFAGEPLPEDLVSDVQRLLTGEVPRQLARWLAPRELIALQARARAMIEHPTYPAPQGDFPFPWPLV